MTQPPRPDAEPDLVETQIERTEMAWVRTALACAGLAVFAAHLSGDGISVYTAAAIGALVGLPGLVAAWWRVGALRATRRPAPPRAVGVAALAGAVAVVDVLVLVLFAA